MEITWRDAARRLQLEIKRIRHHNAKPKPPTPVIKHVRRVAKTRVIRWWALNDLYFFGAHFLGLADYRDPKTGRSRVDPILHRDLCEELERDESILLLLPREHGKSTWTCVWCAWQILRDPNNVAILLISLDMKKAASNMAYIADLLIRPRVRRYFKEVVPDPADHNFRGWAIKNRTELLLRRSKKRLMAEHQVTACGYKTLITGHHFPIVVCDDLIDATNCRTEDRRQEAGDRVGQLISIRNPTGRFVIIGTRYHTDDAYARIIAAEVIDRTILRRATERPPHLRAEPIPQDAPPLTQKGDIDDPLSVPIYSYFDKDMLSRIRKNLRGSTGNDDRWMTQYYNDPHSTSITVFPQPIRTYREIPPNALTTPHMAVDTANTTQGTQSDWSAIIIAHIDESGMIYISHAERVQATWDRVCNNIIRTAIIHRPASITIETTLGEQYGWVYGKVLEDFIRALPQDEPPPRLPPPNFITQARGSLTIPKLDRINSTFGAVYRLNQALPHESLQDLITQMQDYPRGRHDDLVDAAAIAIEKIKPAIRLDTLPYHLTQDQSREHALFQHFAGTSPLQSGYRYGELIRGYR